MSPPSPETRPAVEHPGLQQAPVEPLDAYGLTASVVGTIMFGLAGMACWLIGYRGLWATVAVVAAGLGLLLIPYTAWRRSKALHSRGPIGPIASVED